MVYSIKTVGTKKDKQNWFEFSRKLYRNDPNFISYIDGDIEDLFQPKTNPFLLSGEGQRLLLFKEGEIVGKCAVFYYLNTDKQITKSGIGFFDCIEDFTAFQFLIDYCIDWLKKRNIQEVEAPVNFGDRDSFWGLLIQGKHPNSYRENYHFPYYQTFFESYGFSKSIEQTTYLINKEIFNFNRINNIAQRVLNNRDYQFRYLDYSNLKIFAEHFCEIYNQAWSFHEDFSPVNKNKLYQRLTQIKPILPQDLAIFAYYKDLPIGFYISILELNQLISKNKGKLTLWQKIRFILGRKRIHQVRGIIFGVIPQFHNLGIETGMIMRFYESILRNPQWHFAELAWIGDFNPKMLSLLKSLGAQLHKVHYTYSKKI